MATHPTHDQVIRRSREALAHLREVLEQSAEVARDMLSRTDDDTRRKGSDDDAT